MYGKPNGILQQPNICAFKASSSLKVNFEKSIESSWDCEILSFFSIVSPIFSLDLSIKAAILFGSNNSFFSNSEACFIFVSSIFGFFGFIISFKFSSFFNSSDGFCLVSSSTESFSFFLSGKGIASNFSFFTISFLVSGVGVFFAATSVIFSLFLSKFTSFFSSFFTFLGGACSETSFSLSFFTLSIIFFAFGAKGMFVLSDI